MPSSVTWAIATARVLEVGCSHGSTTISLRERFNDPGIEVWALDIGALLAAVAVLHRREDRVDGAVEREDAEFDEVVSAAAGPELAAGLPEEVVHGVLEGVTEPGRLADWSLALLIAWGASWAATRPGDRSTRARDAPSARRPRAARGR